MKSNDNANTNLVLMKLKDLIDDQMIYTSFIESILIKTLRNGELFFIFPTKNDLKFMTKNYKDEIDQAMKHVFGVNANYLLIYREEFDKYLNNLGNFSLRESNLIERYQFNDYVESKFNQKAVALAKKVIKQDRTFFNPIFIYASSGLGKTHLLHGIGNEISNHKNVCYINPDQFMKKITQYLIKSDQNKLSEIIDYYKEFDVLLFDDIQQYGSKPATLNVLFNILNYHIDNNNQIIIAADKEPDLLGGFEERFVTRFQGGITEKINSPSLDDLILIFKEKLIKSEINPKNWENEAIKFIVRNHSNSIRSLEGAINKIEWNQQNNVEDIKYTYEIVSEMFSNIKESNEDINPDQIVEIIANYYNLNKNDVLGPSRKNDIVLARHISMWMIRNLTNQTYKDIGRLFKGKDHSTIIKAIEKIDYQMKINETIKSTLKLIKKKIKQY